MATKLQNDPGWEIIILTPQEIIAFRENFAQCDICGESIEDYGYYIAAIDAVYCAACTDAYIKYITRHLKDTDMLSNEKCNCQKVCEFFKDLGTWQD